MIIKKRFNSIFFSIRKILDLLQHGLEENSAKIPMAKIYYKQLIYTSLLAVGILFSSCDQITSAIKKEFDSERALPTPIKASIAQPEEVTMEPTPKIEPSPKTPNKEGDFIYFIRGNNVSLVALKNVKNYYLLQMKTIGNPMISFGGVEESNANYLNNLIFFNQWSKGSSRIGALILLKNAPYSIPKDPCITVIVTQPQYDVEFDSASFILQPQGEMRSEFLSDQLSSCVLLIKSNQYSF